MIFSCDLMPDEALFYKSVRSGLCRAETPWTLDIRVSRTLTTSWGWTVSPGRPGSVIIRSPKECGVTEYIDGPPKREEAAQSRLVSGPRKQGDSQQRGKSDVLSDNSCSTKKQQETSSPSVCHFSVILTKHTYKCVSEYSQERTFVQMV